MIPDELPTGHATALALRNFRVSGHRMPIGVVHALARIKGAMAMANQAAPAQTRIDPELGAAIATAADQVATGQWDGVFQLDVFQTGSGTSTNMNVNEVIAVLAARSLSGRTVHPNDHVNASQSSNDTVPTAIRVAALTAVRDVLLPGLLRLRDALAGRSLAFAGVVKVGRTHMMDASPVTLGQEFGGYAAQVREAIERIEDSSVRVAAVPLGGTATGNGLNAPPEVVSAALAELARATGLGLHAAPSRFAAQGSQDALVELSGQLRAAAVGIFKSANDLRLLASGPRAGLGEITLPALQPGSSVLPGKVNPILCEVVTQVAAQVIGNDAAVAFAGTQGSLELNTYLPVIALNLLDSIRLLGRVAADFADHCVAGIEADVERCRTLAESSTSMAVALNPVLGYDAATRVVQQAIRERRSVRSVLLDQHLLPPDQVDALLDLDRIAAGSDIAADVPLSPVETLAASEEAITPSTPDPR